MSARYYFKLVAVQSDGDIYDNESPVDAQPTLASLGQDGWHVVGVLPESSVTGYEHTLILQQRVETYLASNDDDYLSEGDPT